MSTIDPQEISSEILTQKTTLRDAFGETLTVAEVRAQLQALGLDVTTREALFWGVRSPVEARQVTTICELDQQIEDAKNAPPLPERKAAE